MEVLYWVDAGFACGGVMVKNGKVTACAPILRKWFNGKTVKQCIDLIKTKRWKYQVLTR